MKKKTHLTFALLFLFLDLFLICVISRITSAPTKPKHEIHNPALPCLVPCLGGKRNDRLFRQGGGTRSALTRHDDSRCASARRHLTSPHLTSRRIYVCAYVCVSVRHVASRSCGQVKTMPGQHFGEGSLRYQSRDLSSLN